jgi:hypothetical protein
MAAMATEVEVVDVVKSDRELMEEILARQVEIRDLLKRAEPFLHLAERMQGIRGGLLGRGMRGG